jgi:hypothetical protein
MTWVTGLGERHPLRVFNMDDWYSQTPLKHHPGIVPYGPWRKEVNQGKGVWSQDWVNNKIYPTNIDNWPGHERWFDQKYSPLSCEYTLWQNIVFAASAFGFLTDDAGQITNPNAIQQSAGSNGLVEMEAESFTSKVAGSGSFAGMNWTEYNDADASNNKYMVVPDNGNKNGGTSDSSPHLDFKVNFVHTGTHYIWIRMNSGNNGGDDSVTPRYNSSVITEFHFGADVGWKWVKCPVTFNAATGVQTVSIYMREDGTKVDKVILTKSNSYVPGQPTDSFSQETGSNGLVEMEAESFTSKVAGSGSFAGMNWTEYNDADASNNKYMVVPDNGNKNGGTSDSSPHLDFKVNFVHTGTHYIWIRMNSGNNGGDDSVTPRYNSSVITEFHFGADVGWKWVKCPVTFNAATGVQTVSIYMREDGTKVDKIILTKNNSYTPSNSLFSKQSNKSVDNYSGDEVFKLYPNPISEGLLSLEFASGQIMDSYLVITDIRGKQIYSNMFKQTAKIQLGIKPLLSTGIYILQVTREGHTYQRKIVVD